MTRRVRENKEQEKNMITNVEYDIYNVLYIINKYLYSNKSMNCGRILSLSEPTNTRIRKKYLKKERKIRRLQKAEKVLKLTLLY